jgi:thiamine-monophosphate kinase
VELGRAIRPLASAAIDVSDGLLADLGHICSNSGCGARIDLESLPQSKAMQANFSAEECERMSLSGGDDYELIFTVPSERILDVEAAITSGVRCTPIGRIVEGSNVECFRGGKRVEILKRGYDHFA